MPKPQQPASPATATDARGRHGSRSKVRAGVQGRPGTAGVTLSHPDRVLFPEQGVTKAALAGYYVDVADWALPHLQRRPLALVRCPEGHTRQCFFQKHPGAALADALPRAAISEKAGKADYVYVEDTAHLVSLVQVGVLEIHVWGSRVDHLEQPDIAVFDLDPGDDVAWRVVIDTARGLRSRLADLGLTSFLRTTGGKGLHLVMPLQPQLEWDAVKEFARAVAERHAADDPAHLTTNMSKAQRGGRVFIDYLRNGRGATAIASYSTRARAGAPVATPVRWDELGPRLTSQRYHLGNVRRRLNALGSDPWEGFDDARRPLTRKMLKAVGADAGTTR